MKLPKVDITRAIGAVVLGSAAFWIVNLTVQKVILGANGIDTPDDFVAFIAWSASRRPLGIYFGGLPLLISAATSLVFALAIFLKKERPARTSLLPSNTDPSASPPPRSACCTRITRRQTSGPFPTGARRSRMTISSCRSTARSPELPSSTTRRTRSGARARCRTATCSSWPDPVQASHTVS